VQTLFPDLQPVVPARITVTNKLPTEPAPPGLAYYVASTVEWEPDEIRRVLAHAYRLRDYGGPNSHDMGNALQLIDPLKLARLGDVRLSDIDRDQIADLGYNLITRYAGIPMFWSDIVAGLPQGCPSFPLPEIMTFTRLVHCMSYLAARHPYLMTDWDRAHFVYELQRVLNDLTVMRSPLDKLKIVHRAKGMTDFIIIEWTRIFGPTGGPLRLAVNKSAASSWIISEAANAYVQASIFLYPHMWSGSNVKNAFKLNNKVVIFESHPRAAINDSELELYERDTSGKEGPTSDSVPGEEDSN
jgi:hypothetical protein